MALFASPVPYPPYASFRRLAVRRALGLATIASTFLPLGVIAQIDFSSPDQFEMTPSQLMTSGTEFESATVGIDSEFDSFGNRTEPLSPNALATPLLRPSDYQNTNIAKDLGAEALITYRPILDLRTNPYDLSPSIDVLGSIGEVDILKPTVALDFFHDNNVALSIGQGGAADFGMTVRPSIRAQIAADSQSRLDASLGYRPTFRKFLENTQFDGIDHAVFLNGQYPLQKAQLLAGLAFNQTTQPVLGLGGRSTQTSIGSTFGIIYDVTERVSAITSFSYLQNSTSSGTMVALSPLNTASQNTTIIGSNTRFEYLLNPTWTLGFNTGFTFSQGEGQSSSNDTIPLAFTLSYRPGTKLQFEGSFGTSILQAREQGAESFTVYELNANYQATPKWLLETSYGQSAVLTDRVFQSATIADFFRFRIQRLIGRNIRLSGGYGFSQTTAAGRSDALTAAVGDVEQENVFAELNATLRSNLILGFSYRENTAQTTGITLIQETVRYSLNLTYRF